MSNITKGQDGLYRWVHELNLYKNPVVLFTIWKLFGIVFAAIFVLTIFLPEAIRDIGYFSSADFTKDLKFIGIFCLGMLALSTLSYYLYALFNGCRYCVIFEMGEGGVRHIQMEKNVEKAQAIGALTVLAGLAAKNLTTVGIGMMSGAKTESYSEWSRVKSVKCSRLLHTIKVNETLEKNQVYTAPEDYEFVRNYIVSHCPQAKIKG